MQEQVLGCRKRDEGTVLGWRGRVQGWKSRMQGCVSTVSGQVAISQHHFAERCCPTHKALPQGHCSTANEMPLSLYSESQEEKRDGAITRALITPEVKMCSHPACLCLSCLCFPSLVPSSSSSCGSHPGYGNSDAP